MAGSERPQDARDVRPSILDGMAARGVALLVLLLVVAGIGWLNRESLFPPEQAAVPADDPVARCLAERAAGIDEMRAQGTIDDDQARLFKSRAEALCQAQVGGSGQPPLPGQ